MNSTDVSETGYTGHVSTPTGIQKSSPIIAQGKTMTPIPSGANYLIKPMSDTKKIKKYKKRDLRLTLEQRMQEYWNDPTRKVTPMEFSRMLKAYCEEFDLPDEIRRAKELDEPLVDAFGTWLGYPLH